MKSLRLTLVFFSLGFQLITFAVFLAANRTLIEPYFVYRAQRSMKSLYESNSGDPEKIRLAAPAAGFKSATVTASGMIVDSSSPEFSKGSSPLTVPKDQLAFFLGIRDTLSPGQCVTGVIDREPNGQSVIQLVSALPGDSFLIMTQPLKQVRVYVGIAGTFFIILGSLLALVSVAGASIISWHFVRPIVTLTRIAERTASLDFTQRYEGKGKDELARLGESMNVINARMDEAFAKVQDRISARERFFANVSHEFKTPIGLIRGYAEMLESGAALSDVEKRRALATIVEETDRLTDLINDSITLSAIESGKIQTRMERVCLMDVLMPVQNRFAQALESKGLTLSIRIDGNLRVTADPLRLTEVFENLLSNAVRYAKRDTAVAVTGFERVDARTGLRETRIAVENQGAPIPEDVLASIFEPFGHVGRKRGRDGTGLGLSIVASVMRLHGGTCSVENTPSGVCCRLVFPDARV